MFPQTAQGPLRTWKYEAGQGPERTSTWYQPRPSTRRAKPYAAPSTARPLRSCSLSPSPALTARSGRARATHVRVTGPRAADVRCDCPAGHRGLVCKHAVPVIYCRKYNLHPVAKTAKPRPARHAACVLDPIRSMRYSATAQRRCAGPARGHPPRVPDLPLQGRENHEWTTTRSRSTLDSS